MLATTAMLLAVACGGASSAPAPQGAGQAGPAAAGQGAGGAGGQRQGGGPPVDVKLATVERGEIPETVSVVGTLRGEEDLTLSAEQAGRLSALHYDLGARVAPGALMAEIDPRDYEIALQAAENQLAQALAGLGLTSLPRGSFDIEAVPTVQRAQAQADNARLRAERGQALFNRKPPMLSAQELADLETAAAVAKGDAEVARLEARGLLAQAQARASEVEAARKRLADTRVEAPAPAGAAGATTSTYAVATRLLEVGEYVSAGTPLYRLVRDQPIRLRAAVPERLLGQVAVGQPANVRVDSYDRSFAGQVSRLSPAIDPQSRTFEVEVTLPNKELLLRPGAFATAELVTGSQRGVALVPHAAVVSFAGVDRVFSVAGGKAAEHLIKLGPPQPGGRIAVLDGLATATQVVVGNAGQLGDGRPVRVAEAAQTRTEHDQTTH